MAVGFENGIEKHFSAINTPVSLTLTVRSYPEPTFAWSKSDVNTNSATHESNGNDEYTATFEISNVRAIHYGNYTVVVRSGGDNSFSTTFIVQLVQQGRF